MLDAIELHWNRTEFLRRLRLDENKAVIALFPGSRPREFRYMLPMLLRSAEIIARDLRAVQFVIGVSPFVTEALLRSTLAEPSLAPDGTGE